MDGPNVCIIYSFNECPVNDGDGRACSSQHPCLVASRYDR
jgi:hypothetical protein